MTNVKTIRSSVRTPDGFHLESKYRHDFQCHIDANGKRYCIDGGLDYFRFTGDYKGCKDTSLHTGMHHEQLREEVTWGTFGRYGMIDYVLVKNLSLTHLHNIINDGYKSPTVDVLKMEILWRAENETESESNRLEIQREASY